MAAVVGGLATFPIGGAAAVLPDDGDPPVIERHGILQLHLGADGNHFRYTPDGGSSADQSSRSAWSCSRAQRRSPW